MELNPEQPQHPEDLPWSLFPGKRQPLKDASPQELDRLAGSPQKIVPLPEGLTPKQAAQLRNLAQYKGRSPEGQRRALGNLPRETKSMNKTEHQIVPADKNSPARVPMVFIQPPGLTTIRGRSTAAVMSQEEYNLYCETWKRYMEVHSEDYSAPEDEDDLHRICMETVIQWRIEMQKLHAPRTAIGSEYHQSVKRMQTARENLAARRADRIATKGGGRGTNINIAVVAGNVDAAKAIQIKGERVKQLDAAEDDFLNNTGQSDAQQHEIIDVQVEPAENPPETGENSP